MGYNRDNFAKVSAEYEVKYQRAVDSANIKCHEVYEKIPELVLLDRELSQTAIKIISVSFSSDRNDIEDINKQVGKIRKSNEKLLEKRAEILKAHGYPADYTDIRYDCEKCSDTGYVGEKMCSCMKQALVMEGYRSSGISNLITLQTFENFSLDCYHENAEQYNNMCYVYKTLKAYATDFKNCKTDNFILFGGTGLGKTHLSSAVAGKVIENGYDVLYVSILAMLSDFEQQRFGSSGFGEEGNNINRYYNCDLLIVDDLGSEITNQFTTTCIYNLINTRLNKRVSTIISSNLNQNDFRKRYWDRITSRIFGEYTPMLFVGKDIRLQKLKK